MSLSTAMVAYQSNLDLVVESSASSSQTKEDNPYASPAWAGSSSHSHDYLDDIFPSDEAILEAMSGLEQPWRELHHRSYFLPKLDDVYCDEFKAIFSKKIDRLVVPLGSPRKYAKGNVANLSPTIPINIYCIPGKFENMYIWVDCSPDEIIEYIKIFK